MIDCSRLDRPDELTALDSQDMIGHIRALPAQLTAAWDLAMNAALPEWRNFQQILVAGMGGSAIGADLLAAYVEPFCPVPVSVQRDYTLPAWVNPVNTLVIASSHSGNTEETLSVVSQAQERGCAVLSVCTGGELMRLSQAAGIPVIQFEHRGQPRAAVGYSFGILLGVLHRYGLIPDQREALEGAAAAMRSQESALRVEAPVKDNPAKRAAGQLVDRWVVVFGSGLMAPVARRWKGQISEIAKAWAQAESLPEADHNSLAGLAFPRSQLDHMTALFLEAAANHPRNLLRSSLTREIFMVEGIGTDVFQAKGDTPMQQLWTMIQLGDYLAYYLAMIYGVDPTPIEFISGLKAAMAEA